MKEDQEIVSDVEIDEIEWSHRSYCVFWVPWWPNESHNPIACE